MFLSFSVYWDFIFGLYKSTRDNSVKEIKRYLCFTKRALEEPRINLIFKINILTGDLFKPETDVHIFRTIE